VVNGIRIYAANDNAPRDPASFTLEGSNDGGTTWTRIAADMITLSDTRNGTGTGTPINPATQVNARINFPNTTSYTSYRVLFPTLKSSQVATGIQIGEIELLNQGVAVATAATSDAVSVATGGSVAFSAPATSLGTRRMTLYVGANGGTGHLTVTMTDGSVFNADLVDSNPGDGVADLAKYVIDYKSGIDNQTLNVNYSAVSGSNVFMGATLTGVTGVDTPAAPTGLTATALTSRRNTLAWTDNATNESGFRVFRAPASTGDPNVPGAFVAIGTTGPIVVSFTDATATPGQKYFYQVTAFNGGESAAVSADTTTLSRPAPWLDSDIGLQNNPLPQFTGDVGFSPDGTSATVTGSGADIWDAQDRFHFVYQKITGDIQITARVMDVFQTDVWAKAGLMVREHTGNNSRQGMIVLSAANGVRVQGRLGQNAASVAIGTDEALAGAGPGSWFRISRVGDTVNFYLSSDGITFNLVRTQVFPALAQDIYIGLAVTSHNVNAITTAHFQNIAFAPPDTTGPLVTGFSLDRALPAGATPTTKSHFAITFSENVQASLDDSDVQLLGVTSGQVISGTLHYYDTATNTAIYTINDLNNPGLAPSELLDDNYTLRVFASITDGDGNVLRGDGVTNGTNHERPFNKYRGDTQMTPGGADLFDRKVTFADFQRLERNQGMVNPSASDGDFNYDGVIDYVDFNILYARMNTSLPAPASPTPSTGTTGPTTTKPVVTKPPGTKPVVTKPATPAKPVVTKPAPKPVVTVPPTLKKVTAPVKPVVSVLGTAKKIASVKDWLAAK
jgi:regulation of enolase protein 1 (concanavalin A-like superfamily)